MKQPTPRENKIKLILSVELIGVQRLCVIVNKEDTVVPEVSNLCNKRTQNTGEQRLAD